MWNKRFYKLRRIRRQLDKKFNNTIFLITSACIVLLIIIVAIIAHNVSKNGKQNTADPQSVQVSDDTPKEKLVTDIDGLEIIEDYLTVNPYSRPGKALKEVNGIVIHYTANPGSSAEANRDYFEGLKDAHSENGKNRYASSHYIIGLDGEIIQCIPLDEIAYASNNRNSDTIAIECCHPDKSGKFTDETYESLVKLTAWLCGKYDVGKDSVIRHYDVTGKNCPKYYVKHEKKWKQFKKDVFKHVSAE